jgi:hypothetical protein
LSAIGDRPVFSAVSLLQLTYVLFAAGVALTKCRYVSLTSTRIPDASRLMSPSEPDRAAGAVAICLSFASIGCVSLVLQPPPALLATLIYALPQMLFNWGGSATGEFRARTMSPVQGLPLSFPPGRTSKLSSATLAFRSASSSIGIFSSVRIALSRRRRVSSGEFGPAACNRATIPENSRKAAKPNPSPRSVLGDPICHRNWCKFFPKQAAQVAIG